MLRIRRVAWTGLLLAACGGNVHLTESHGRAYREAVRLANLRYASGLSAYFEVLDAQQQLFPAELALAQTRRNQKLAVIGLYRALGGGWQREGEAAVP